MRIIDRAVRHARLSLMNRGLPSPPFLVLFINSLCNMRCEHCFYWTHLNKRDDLSVEEIFALSRSLGRIENLNLSGGEPFLRKEFSDICRQFIRHNGVRQIYVPTNGWFEERTVEAVTEVLQESELDLLAVELSLDGMAEFHDKFRVAKGSFRRAMQTYEALARLQRTDPRLRIHAISTATNVNVEEIRRLTTYLYERCPQMDHHNLAIIRGDRKNPALLTPPLDEYRELFEYIRRLWAQREQGRYGGIVEPMLQWAKLQTLEKKTQVVKCRAGVLTAVVAANGDVSVCELHEPLGNLRQQSFWEIWNSPKATQLRDSIARKACHCTTEVFLWPSIVFQPTHLARAMVGAKVWRRIEPLPAAQTIKLTAAELAQATVAPRGAAAAAAAQAAAEAVQEAGTSTSSTTTAASAASES
jgi:MoaA/NifB/PqqE/SkfB family radical SAM enzyme